MNTTIPEVPVPEVEYDWFHFMFLKMIKNFLVVVVTYYCILVYGKHVYIEHSFFNVSNPICKPGINIFD